MIFPMKMSSGVTLLGGPLRRIPQEPQTPVDPAVPRSTSQSTTDKTVLSHRTVSKLYPTCNTVHSDRWNESLADVSFY